MNIGYESSANADQMVGDVVDRELPGFWSFLKERHPQFKGYGKPDGPPLGYIHAFEVHEAMAETIPVYVRALRQAL
jgi:hypothetical protein